MSAEILYDTCEEKRDVKIVYRKKGFFFALQGSELRMVKKNGNRNCYFIYNQRDVKRARERRDAGRRTLK